MQEAGERQYYEKRRNVVSEMLTPSPSQRHAMPCAPQSANASNRAKTRLAYIYVFFLLLPYDVSMVYKRKYVMLLR